MALVSLCQKKEIGWDANAHSGNGLGLCKAKRVMTPPVVIVVAFVVVLCFVAANTIRSLRQQKPVQQTECECWCLTIIVTIITRVKNILMRKCVRMHSRAVSDEARHKEKKMKSTRRETQRTKENKKRRRRWKCGEEAERILIVLATGDYTFPHLWLWVPVGAGNVYGVWMLYCVESAHRSSTSPFVALGVSVESFSLVSLFSKLENPIVCSALCSEHWAHSN